MALPKQEVVGPSYVPLFYGLFSAIPPREDAGLRWTGDGISFPNLGWAEEDQTVRVECPEGGVSKVIVDFDAIGKNGITYSTGDAFLVQAAFQCSPVGMSAGDAQNIAELRLTRLEEKAVELALTSSTLDLSPNLLNPETVGSYAGIRLGLAGLEGAMASAYSETGIIHMSRENAMLGLASSVIESRGGRLHTSLGTPVVAGAGYTFSDLRGTPSMLAYRSSIFSYEDSALFDKDYNARRALAQRYYALGMSDGKVLSATITPEEG